MALQDDDEYKTVVFSDNSSQVYPNNSEPDGEVTIILEDAFSHFFLENSESPRPSISDRSS